RASRPPPLSPDCVDDGRDQAELRIEGLADGAALARPPGSRGDIRVSLRALGADGPVQWLLDGRWVATTRGSALQYGFAGSGRHRLTALADSGAWATVEFRILP
ncbi:penicillin-binding protein 1C, partial [Luteimonas sp. SDU101]